MGNVQVQKFSWKKTQGREMALHYKKARAKTFCSLEYFVFVLLNDRSRMKGDFHVRFCEKFEVKFLLLTRLRGREIRMISLLLDLHRKDMVTMKSESERFSYVKNGMYTDI